MRMWPSIASNALTLLIVILAGFGIALAMAQNTWENAGPLEEVACVTVPRGATMRQMSETLAEDNIISSAVLFRLGADYKGRSAALKAGNFLIPEGASMDNVSRLLTAAGQSTCGSDVNLVIGVTEADLRVREFDPGSGDFEVTTEIPVSEPIPASVQEVLDQGFARTRVTVAEGVTSWQVAQALGDAGFLTGSISGTPEEGRLAPGSYEVEVGSDRSALVERMVARQAAALEAAWNDRAADLPLDNPEEALILASIVEKETGVADERPQVASVFVNRLRAGMRLQTDPTVIYGVTEGQGTLNRGLRQSELDRATPYNTYVILGLPPTPIANPGIEAINATLNPAETEYRFFVADGTGGHAFARTLAEHNQNVQRWREIERQRNQ